jgi:Leucine-rich repeat (LRR) protein
LDQYALDTREKPWYETVQLEPLPKKYFTILEEANFSWRTLSSDNPLLDVRFHGSELDAKALLALEEVAPYITWLNLSDSNLQGTQTKVLAKMENLTHLQLQKNPIRVQDLTFLDSLKHLTILNLHSTLVNNTVLEKVKNLSHLEKLYLWNTRVNPTFIERNRARIPKTTVISGI